MRCDVRRADLQVGRTLGELAGECQSSRRGYRHFIDENKLSLAAGMSEIVDADVMGGFLLFVLDRSYRQPEWMENAFFLCHDADLAAPGAVLQ